MMLLFVAYPIVSVLQKSLTVDDQPGLGNYVAVFTQPHLFKIIWGGLLVSVGVAVLATLLGLLIALTVFKTSLPLRPLFAGAAILPMILPGFVTSLAYIFLFGRNGFITYKLLGLTWDIYSWRSVVILQTLGFSTTTFLLISAALTGVDSQVEDAARSLGATEWKVLTTVTLPLIRPGIVGALLLAFLRSMADFGTPFIVGGKFNTLATASYTQLIGAYNMEMAATLNVILLIFCLLAFGLFTRVQAMNVNVRIKFESGRTKSLRLSRQVNAVLWGVSLGFAVIILMFLVSIFLAAFTKHIGANFALTLEHFAVFRQRGLKSTGNTLLFAAVTSMTMSVMGLTLAYWLTRLEFKGQNAISALATLPFAIPGTFMGVGYALAFNQPPLLLTGTWSIIIACTVIRELPLGLRAGVSLLMQQDRAVEDASASLGANRFITFWRIIVPLARPVLVVSALYAFVASVKTLGAIIFLITPGTKVLAVDIFEATVRGDVGDAAAFSMVAVAIAAVGSLGIYLYSSRKGSLSPLQK
jgi:iron(III) transport system permease protein